MTKCIDDKLKYKKTEEVKAIWNYIYKFCFKWYKDNEMMKYFILSGFDVGVMVNYFHKS